MNEILKKRFNDLVTLSKQIEDTKYDVCLDPDPEFGSDYYVDYAQFCKWKVQAQDLLSKVCGVESYYFQEFEKLLQHKEVTSLEIFQRLSSVFLAAKEDFENGYLISIRTLIEAEVFDSELEQAKELLDKEYFTAAAVITGVILETSLRNLCIKKNIEIIDTSGKMNKLDKMNSDLAKAGVYNKLTQKRITVRADIRNSAAHGLTDKSQKQDVHNMIREVEEFLANYFALNPLY